MRFWPPLFGAIKGAVLTTTAMFGIGRVGCNFVCSRVDGGYARAKQPKQKLNA